MKKILIVDDHAIVRHGLFRVLQEIFDSPCTCDEASSGEQGMNMVCTKDYDLVLLDISLPDQSGLVVLKHMLEHDPALRVVILSTHAEEQYAIRAIRLGAVGYVNKGSATIELKNTIETVLSGRRYISPSQAELLANNLCDGNQSKPLHQNLSEREYQVACMMTAGKTLTGIATTLAMSVSTVSTYRVRVLEKLRLKTTADIINYFLRHNLFL